ncbi:MAG: amidohydrolase family protein [Burkholderiales bacterium]
MANVSGQRIIALEEHYLDPEIGKFLDSPEIRRAHIRERLEDVDKLRLQEMDAGGIDLQVLSHQAPATHRMDAASAVPLCVGANDRLHAICQRHPTRFAGFATLPAVDPKAAADELERAVTRYGFKGAMVHGLTHGEFIDTPKFWPIFERAQALDVPIYVHPALPHPAVIEAYYKDYANDYPQILTAGWGFTVETATQGLRLVLSGIFEKYPRLKIILGHLGEGLPFSLWRIDQAFARSGNKAIPFREVFREHFYITTSGNFSTAAMLCSVMEMGVDRILFSIDYPFVDNRPGPIWMDQLPLATEDKVKILSGNAERLLKLR